MTTTNRLSAIDTLSPGDQSPVFVSGQGDARKFSMTTLVSYLSTAFTSFSASSYVKTPAVLVASLPSAATAGAGARAMVSNSNTVTFNATVAGGGSSIVPVFSDGTNWKVG